MVRVPLDTGVHINLMSPEQDFCRRNRENLGRNLHLKSAVSVLLTFCGDVAFTSEFYFIIGPDPHKMRVSAGIFMRLEFMGAGDNARTGGDTLLSSSSRAKL